eukprot:CAMPEP_0170544560 /NCGR_PEP_ID=MMETSP0211-20121228/3273_1 /TAXON_ID=311385 /ORGANISM="Pseudokeronopsis sp., Strain OXSARD2" /LENGTH=92 /DNA_ID=CAMNT_0010848235 /DNA_START=4529 /DNA_END=4807 /DNA_ORIENTATION=+
MAVLPQDVQGVVVQVQVVKGLQRDIFKICLTFFHIELWLTQVLLLVLGGVYVDDIDVDTHYYRHDIEQGTLSVSLHLHQDVIDVVVEGVSVC